MSLMRISRYAQSCEYSPHSFTRLEDDRRLESGSKKYRLTTAGPEFVNGTTGGGRVFTLAAGSIWMSIENYCSNRNACIDTSSACIWLLDIVAGAVYSQSLSTILPPTNTSQNGLRSEYSRVSVGAIPRDIIYDYVYLPEGLHGRNKPWILRDRCRNISNVP